jgi:hypothetical protein
MDVHVTLSDQGTAKHLSYALFWGRPLLWERAPRIERPFRTILLCREYLGRFDRTFVVIEGWCNPSHLEYCTALVFV